MRFRPWHLFAILLLLGLPFAAWSGRGLADSPARSTPVQTVHPTTGLGVTAVKTATGHTDRSKGASRKSSKPKDRRTTPVANVIASTTTPVEENSPSPSPLITSIEPTPTEEPTSSAPTETDTPVAPVEEEDGVASTQ